MEKKEVDFASLKYFSICVNLLDKKAALWDRFIAFGFLEGIVGKRELI